MRRRDLLAGLSFVPLAAPAVAQCVLPGFPRINLPGRCETGSVGPVPDMALDFMTPGTLDPRVTFTRASTGTYFDSAGLMRTAAVNLWLQSADANQWAKGQVVSGNPTTTANQVAAPDGTTTAARVVYPAVAGAGNASLLFQSTVINTGVYVVSVYLRGNVGGEQIYLGVNVSATYYSAPRITLTTSWQRYTFTTPSLAVSTYAFTIGTDLRDGAQTATSAQTVFMWGAQLELGSAATPYIPTTTTANGAPRWDYDPSTLQLRGLLVEEARTNLALYSGDMSNVAWAPAGAVVAAPTPAGNQVVAPDGNTAGARITYPAITGAGALSMIQHTFVATPAAYTFSVYMRGAVGGEQTYIMLRVTAGAYYKLRVTLTTSWQRYTITSPALTAASWFAAIGADLRDGTQTTTPAQSIYVWGGQIELGLFPTSLIPTTTASVLRATDNMAMTGANFSSWFNASAGSFVAEASYPVAMPVAHAGRFIELSDGTVANFLAVMPQFATAQAQIASTIASVAGTSLLPNTGSLTVDYPARAGVTYSTQRTAAGKLAPGGMGPVVSTPGGIAPLINQLGIGNRADGQRPFDGHIRSVRYWSRALSDADLQAVINA